MSVAELLRRATSGLLDVLLPARCLLCGGGVDTRRSTVPLCRKHREALPRLTGPRCYRCSRPMAGPDLSERTPVSSGIVEHSRPGQEPHAPSGRAPLCGVCRREDSSVIFTLAAYTYTDPLRTIVQDWKFGGYSRWGSWLGGRMAECLRDRLETAGWEGLVPIPLSRSRRRERGFNQAMQLAQAAGETLGLPVLDRLRKTRETPPQSRLPRTRRLRNLQGVFAPREGPPLRNTALLLVDDIYTTGATLEAAAAVLRGAGAGNPGALVLARSVGRYPRKPTT